MAAAALIGRVVLAFLATTGRLTMFAAATDMHCFRPPIYPRLIWRQVVDDNLHPSGKVHTPWGDTIVTRAESVLLKEETP